MKKKYYLIFAMIILAGLFLTFAQGQTEDEFDTEGFTTELENMEGANTEFYASDDFNAEGNVDYDIDSETGMITFSSSSETGSVFIEGQEFDVSEEGELIMDKEGNIVEGKNINVANRADDFDIGSEQSIENLPKDAQFSFSKEDGTFSYAGPEGEKNLDINGINFDEKMNINLVEGIKESNLDFSVLEEGGSMNFAGGEFTLPQGSYSANEGIWELSGATIEKFPDFEGNPLVDYSSISDSRYDNRANVDMILNGENIKVSQEISGREDLSFDGALAVNDKNFMVLAGTKGTEMNNGVRFDNFGGSKTNTDLFLKDDSQVGQGNRPSLYMGEDAIKGDSKANNKVSSVILGPDNDYCGDLMSQRGGDNARMAIGTSTPNRAGSYSFTGTRDVEGEKRLPVLEREGDITFENGNKMYRASVEHTIVEEKIDTSRRETGVDVSEKTPTPSVMVTKRGGEPSITSVVTEKGTFHGYETGASIEERTIEDIDTMNPQSPVGIPTRANPSDPYKISSSDLSRDYEDKYREYESAVKAEKGIQKRKKVEYQQKLYDEMSRNEADDLANKLSSAQTNEQVQEIADSYYEETGESLPSLEGFQYHDENLLNIESNLNYLKKQGIMSESEYEKITSLGVNERELIQEEMSQGEVSWDEAYERVFIEGENDVRIGPRVLHNKYDLGPSQWVYTRN